MHVANGANFALEYGESSLNGVLSNSLAKEVIAGLLTEQWDRSYPSHRDGYFTNQIFFTANLNGAINYSTIKIFAFRYFFKIDLARLRRGKNDLTQNFPRVFGRLFVCLEKLFEIKDTASVAVV